MHKKTRKNIKFQKKKKKEEKKSSTTHTVRIPPRLRQISAWFFAMDASNSLFISAAFVADTNGLEEFFVGRLFRPEVSKVDKCHCRVCVRVCVWAGAVLLAEISARGVLHLE